MGHCEAMQGAFLAVVVIVGVVGLAGALIALALSGGAWESLGRDRMLMESDLRDPRARPRTDPAGRGPTVPGGGDREVEIRQMLEARNRRRRRREEPELDVEAELARLLRAPAGGAAIAPRGESARADAAPAVDAPAAPAGPDPELVAEVRALVLARNHRRLRRGQPPLDVEAEVARQIARLTG